MMSMPEKAQAARVIAKLLATRPTPVEEVPALIDAVERALSMLDARPAEKPVKPSPARAAAPARERAQRAVAPPEPPVTTPPIVPAQPTLVRRAAMIAPPPAPVYNFAPAASGTVRGVVQWFDNRTGRGALRLPGFSNDVAVDARTLAAFGITRLFKGQEIDATVEDAGEAPKIRALHLANAPPTSPVNGGTVRDRHAKSVVVELKREATNRSAARAEAELLIRPRRTD